MILKQIHQVLTSRPSLTCLWDKRLCRHSMNQERRMLIPLRGISVCINWFLRRPRPQMSSPSAPLGREEGERTQSISLLVHIAEPGYYFTFPKMNRQLPASPSTGNLGHKEIHTSLQRHTSAPQRQCPPHTHTHTWWLTTATDSPSPPTETASFWPRHHR